jgi:hypothetical protein
MLFGALFHRALADLFRTSGNPVDSFLFEIEGQIMKPLPEDP